MLLVARIKARLKAKYSGVNLSTKRIDAIAAKLIKKLKDESEDSEIDTALDDINDITPFADIAKDDDRVRTLEAQKAKNSKPANEEDDEDEEEVETVKPVKTRRSKDDPPAWAVKLQQDLDAIKGDKQKSSIAEKIKANPKLKEIPEKFYKGRALPEKEEDIEAFVDEIETDYTEFIQDRIDNGLETSSKPILGSVNKEGVSSATEAYIASKTATDKPGGDLGGKQI